LLYRDAEMAALPPNAAQVLLVLVEHAGEVVTKADLRMGLILVQKGSHQRAIAELIAAVALANRSTETLAALAAAFAAAGSNEQAKELLSQLERSQPQQYVLPYNIAKIYAAARNKSKAFDWLDKACDEGNPDLIDSTPNRSSTVFAATQDFWIWSAASAGTRRPARCRVFPTRLSKRVEHNLSATAWPR
jgi:tetratricopeptide (TPR) repeat protein